MCYTMTGSTTDHFSIRMLSRTSPPTLQLTIIKDEHPVILFKGHGAIMVAAWTLRLEKETLIYKLLCSLS